MKRLIGPFAVEYKRRSKLTKPAANSLWGGALDGELKDLLRSEAAQAEAAAEPAPAKPAKPRAAETQTRGRAKTPRSGRILETREEPAAIASEEPETYETPEADEPPRRTRAKRARAEDALARAEAAPAPEPAVMPADLTEASEPEADEAETVSAAPVAPRAPGKPVSLAPSSYGARRREQTKRVDFAERWKWNLVD